MSWEKDYEHWRDKGRTWGPGVDDAEPYTEDELARVQARQEAHKAKIKAYSVAPREVFVKAGEQLAKTLPSSSDISSGKAPMNWREEYSKNKLALCKAACESLGYPFEYGWAGKYLSDEPDGKFFVSVEFHGWIQEHGGNLHDFFAVGIDSVEDCLQLVADFGAIGAESTTWYGRDFHYSTRNTGELRYELIRLYGVGEPVGRSLDETLDNAIERSDEFGNNALVKADIEKE